MSTILVIDDDKNVRDLLRIMLEGEGYAVVLADNGKSGVRVYLQRPTDLVICDLFMDEQEGLATIRQIREKSPQAKIIAISGGSTLAPGDFLSIASLLGAVAALMKPLDRVSLLQTVRKALQG
jgi:DNA-binding NtrC family response regulator